MYICELCKSKSNISYSTLKYGEICNNCMRKIRNSEEEKLRRREEIERMYIKYSVEI